MRRSPKQIEDTQRLKEATEAMKEAPAYPATGLGVLRARVRVLEKRERLLKADLIKLRHEAFGAMLKLHERLLALEDPTA